jgi:AraC-like DNA-binding protein
LGGLCQSINPFQDKLLQEMILKSLLITGIIQGFFLILLLKSKRKNAISDYLLMAWFGIVSFQLMFYYDNLLPAPFAPNFMQILGFYLPLLSSPILYLYVYSFSVENDFLWTKYWIHLLPYSIFCVICFSLNFIHSDSITFSNGLPNFDDNFPFWFRNTLTIPLAIIPAFYTILSLLALIKYQKLIPENYSYTEKINLNWLKWIVISLLLVFVTLFPLITYGVNLGLVTNQNLFAVVGSILTFYLFFIGFFGLQQTTVFMNIAVETISKSTTDSKPNYKNSGLNDEMVDDLFQKLVLHMKQNKPYLDENLSLATLAQQLVLSSNQLSQIINQKTSSNFFNFINGYRVEAVKERLKDPAFAHYSILAIGYDCGFQSKSSFNKIFKQMVGKTPLEFQKS